ncbi:MAG: NADH-quinone oxidoreductase subunit D [Candidatus Omnitrophica bacterium]|nr:NADH-quinone oxidoreductase subunit D [Candidatus Omnitrophota bacterium]
MYGIHIEHHPNLKRLLLPEYANFHPLRKGFTFEGDSVEDANRAWASEREASEKVSSAVLEKSTRDYFINMGPQHPSTHGVLRFLLHMDGETILNVEPVVGYAHRADEKMGENGNYFQFLPYPSRVDYLAGMIYNWGYVGTVERMLSLEAPLRTQYIRVIVSELQRLASHLLWYGAFLMDLGSFTPFLYCFQDREEIIDMFEMCDGSRLTYNYFRFGGMERDLSPEFLVRAREFIPMMKSHLKDYEKLVTKNVIFKKRTEGVGVITKDLALEYGVSGACLRASGVSYDVRRSEPYGIYNEFEWDVPTRTAGDAYARFEVRVEEMWQSLRIVEQALAKIPEGPYNHPAMPKRVKPNAGECYFCVESPRGQMGIYLISDGTETPYRVKMRTPCYNNLQVIEKIGCGNLLADVVCIMGSLDIVVPDIDR